SGATHDVPPTGSTGLKDRARSKEKTRRRRTGGFHNQLRLSIPSAGAGVKRRRGSLVDGEGNRRLDRRPKRGTTPDSGGLVCVFLWRTGAREVVPDVAPRSWAFTDTDGNA